MRAPLYPAQNSRYERGLLATNVGLAIGFAFIGYRIVAQPDGVVTSDFTVFWTAWTLILHGHASALYDETAQRATQQLLMSGLHFQGGLMAFLNPPHAALVSVPFGWLADHVGERAAFAAWTVGNLALLAVLVRTLCDEWRVIEDRRHQFILGSAVLGFCPVVSALRQGQPSILLAVAVLGLYRAAKAARHWTGGAWLVVLTIKPQLVPIVVIYLAARRNWRLLGCASAILAIVVAITAAALGPTIWFDYVHQVRVLEHFWGSGTPDQMLNVRGALTRMIGLDEHVRIDAVSEAVWLAAMVLVGVVLVRRRIDKARDTRSAYAFVIAVALLSNPHLFIHDAVIWTVPLVLYAAALCDAAGAWRPFALFALSWPLVFAVAGSLDIKSGRLTWLDPHTWVLIAATVIIGCRWPSADERQTVSHASGFGSVTDVVQASK
jgi:hypothetical protein